MLPLFLTYKFILPYIYIYVKPVFKILLKKYKNYFSKRIYVDFKRRIKTKRCIKRSFGVLYRKKLRVRSGVKRKYALCG